MDAQIWTALIGVVVAVFGAVAGYLFTKKQEREALLRQQKLEYYKEFALSLTGILRNEDTPDGHRAFNRVCNSLNLIAPQPVLSALQAFRREIRASKSEPLRRKSRQALV